MLKKWIAVLCLLALSVAGLSTAMADSGLYADSVVMQPLRDQGVSRYVFARTGSGWFADNEVDLEIEAGLMVMTGHLPHSSGTSDDALYCYPPMEVKVWRWDSGAARWVMEQNYDIYSERSATIKLQEDNQIYCVQLYFWNPLTVAISYDNNEEFFYPSPWLMRGCSVIPETAEWGVRKEPTVTATPGSDTIFYRNNPMPWLPQEQ